MKEKDYFFEEGGNSLQVVTWAKQSVLLYILPYTALSIFWVDFVGIALSPESWVLYLPTSEGWKVESTWAHQDLTQGMSRVLTAVTSV